MEENSCEELMHIFRYCFNLMRRQYHQNVHGKVGTQHGQGKILSILRREEGIAQKDLAERLQIRPASLSESLDKMQKNGWIERRTNGEDRRRSNIYLTPEGQEVSLQMIEARRDMANSVFGILNKQEQAQFQALLAKLAEGMEKSGEKAAACK